MHREYVPVAGHGAWLAVLFFLLGVVRCGEEVVDLRSPGHPTDIGF